MAYLIKRLSKRLMLLLLFALMATLPAGCATKAQPQPEEAYQETEPASDLALINNINVVEADQGTIVRITGNKMLTFTSVKQADPVGVVLYFPNTGLDPSASFQTSAKGLVSGIEPKELDADSKTVRVAIDLTRDSTYTINRNETQLEVLFPTTLGDESSPEAAAQPAVATADVQESPMPAATVSEESSQETGEAPEATRLSDVSAKTEDNHEVIRVSANGTIRDYTSFTLTNPTRIVYDLRNIKSPYTNEQSIASDSPWVKRVRYYTHPNKIRLVLDTSNSNPPAYTETPTKDGLVIQVGEDVRAATKKAPVYTAAAEQVSDAGPIQVSSSAIGWVNRIDFTGEAGGKSTILIGTTEKPEYTLEKAGANQLKLTLFNTKLPDYRERPLITTGFESAVNKILPYKQKNAPNQTFFTIDLRESVPYSVEQEGDLLKVHFDASSVPAKPPAAEMTLADSKLMPEKTESPASAQTTSVATPKSAPAAATKTSSQTAETTPEENQKKYTGEPIALDFYETDIKNVFRILREVSGMNFAIDKDVSGTVTLSFDKPVPWDQVLDLILKMNQLGKTMEGNIVRIATLDTLRKEESAREAALLAAQKSKEQELALEPMHTEYIPVNYSNAKSEVLPHIQNILTEGRGKAEVDERNNLIVITDTDRVIKQAKAIVQELDKVTPQVMIEARVVEVNSDVSNELGFDWSVSQSGVDSHTLGGAYDWDLAMNYPPSNTDSGLGFQFSRVAGTPMVIDAQLNALETQSKGKVISAPKIMTLDNKKASIKQGVQVGYFERDDSGGSSTKFKNVDLLLEVTPHVTPDNRVSMTVNITKNDVSGVFNDAPLIATNEAQTEFLVNDGETIVIGGILKKTETTTKDGFPVLKDIPGLGVLFGSRSESTKNQELLIFITPKIVTLAQKAVE